MGVGAETSTIEGAIDPETFVVVVAAAYVNARGELTVVKTQETISSSWVLPFYSSSALRFGCEQPPYGSFSINKYHVWGST